MSGSSRFAVGRGVGFLVGFDVGFVLALIFLATVGPKSLV